MLNILTGQENWNGNAIGFSNRTGNSSEKLIVLLPITAVS
jgi:hypothetical protein